MVSDIINNYHNDRKALGYFSEKKAVILTADKSHPVKAIMYSWTLKTLYCF